MEDPAVPQGEETQTTVDTQESATEEVTATPESTATEETNEVEISTVDDMAEYLTGQLSESGVEINSDALLGLKVTKKINGEDRQISISEAIDNVAQGIAGTERLSQAKDKSRSLMDEATQKSQQADARLAVTAKLYEKIKEKALSGPSQTELARLKAEDPEQYLLRKDQARESQAELASLEQEIVKQVEAAAHEQQQVFNQTLSERLPEEEKKLAKAIPELTDDEKGPALRTKIAESLIERGFTKGEVDQAYDSRLIVMAHEAMLYREGKAKSEVAKKKVFRAPKSIKPGSRAAGGKPATTDRATILYG